MIQWFPGHMAKAYKDIQNIAPVCDLFIVVLDGRAPLSSYNEEFDKIEPNKPRLFVISKIDLSDKSKIEKIKLKFNNDSDNVIMVNLRDKNSYQKILNEAEELLKGKRERERKKGFIKPRLHAIVLGVPNSGKSTLINNMARKNKVKVANKPGVTRQKQWISAGDIQLMDTPGILWPKFDNDLIGIKLAIIGSIKLSIIPLKEIFDAGYKLLSKYYPKKIVKLGMDPELEDEVKIYNNLYNFCENKNFYLQNKELDLNKGMVFFMNYLKNLKGVTYD